MKTNAIQERSVVIAGAGISGLAAALALRKIGWKVTVVEQAAAFGVVGAGILLQANGLIALDALGVGQEVRRFGVPLRALKIRGSSGITYFSNDFAVELPSHLYPLSIMRTELHGILASSCLEVGVKLIAGHRVIGLESNGSGKSLVCQSIDGNRLTLSAPLIIGADGVKSIVRQAAGIEVEPQPLLEGSVHGIVPFALKESRYGAYVGRGEGSGVFPINDNRTFWFWGCTGTTVSNITPETFTTWKKRASANFPFLKQILDTYPEMTGISKYLHQNIKCDRWSNDNVVLIGDAAHAMSPSVGQGANSGLVDAVSIGCYMSYVDSQDQLLEALRYFENERRPKVESFQNAGQRGGVFGHRSKALDEFKFRLKLMFARVAPVAVRKSGIREATGLMSVGHNLHSLGICAPVPSISGNQWVFQNK